MLGHAVRTYLLGVLAIFGSASGYAGTLIVLNKAEASATLYDIQNGRPVVTLPTGNAPHEVAVSPDGRLAVVTNYGDVEPGHSLTVIDIPQGRVMTTIDTTPYMRPHGVMWYPDNRRILVTAETRDALLTIDVSAAQVHSAIPTGQKISHMVTADFENHRAYTANIVSGSVSVIDLVSQSLIKIIPVGVGSEGLALTPNGEQLWVTNRGGNNIAVINTRSLSVVSHIKAGAFPIRISFTPDGEKALVSNVDSGDISVIQTDTLNTEMNLNFDGKVRQGKVPLYPNRFVENSMPIGMVIDKVGKTAYIAHARANLVSVVDLKSLQVLNYLPTGQKPDGLAISSRRVRDGA